MNFNSIIEWLVGVVKGNFCLVDLFLSAFAFLIPRSTNQGFSLPEAPEKNENNLGMEGRHKIISKRIKKKFRIF